MLAFFPSERGQSVPAIGNNANSVPMCCIAHIGPAQTVKLRNGFAKVFVDDLQISHQLLPAHAQCLNDQYPPARLRLLARAAALRLWRRTDAIG